MELSLKIWAESKFNPAPSIRTLQIWARTGQIHPKPRKIGTRWLVQDSAEYRPLESKNYSEFDDPIVQQILSAS